MTRGSRLLGGGRKRLEYVKVSDGLVQAGIVGFVGEYRNATVMLRSDFSYSDESLALCHELMHVRLHPASGTRDPNEVGYNREERVVNIACASLASVLGLGDYADFAARYTMPYPLAEEDPQERESAEQLAADILEMVNGLEPQAHDSYYLDRKGLY